MTHFLPVALLSLWRRYGWEKSHIKYNLIQPVLPGSDGAKSNGRCGCIKCASASTWDEKVNLVLYAADDE